MSVIPATWEVYLGRLWSETSPGKKHKTLSEKQLSKRKIGQGGGSSGRASALQSQGPELKPQDHQNNKKQGPTLS
jgi:hypothetical protein